MLQPIGEILDNYVHYIAEQCLTIVDAIFGVENDNENKPFPFPASVNAECYVIFLIRETTPHNSMGYQYGRGGKLYSYNVTYNNGEISVGGFSPVGRTDSSKWSFSGSAAGQEDIVDGEVDAYVSGTADLCYVAKTFPDRGFSYQMSSTSTINKITFGQYNDGNIFDAGAADCTCTLYAGVSQVNYSSIEFSNRNMTESPPGYYDSTGVGTLPSSSFKSPYKRGVFITSLNDETQINNYITKNGATNNYTTTYTTEAGDTVTVYYGDNYLITKNDPDIQVSYNEVKNLLDPVINKINEDTGSDIKFPAYKELKPDPDPDEDIEVDMPLSDAAFGEGLSHYYVTTVGSSVLNDISSAMSTWDITNTGKDLYRNLLSCRITKVGPIPSESSTFVIYGEELQYNGAPITITKITGNPSMDLGEYEILPKFNDFRDYAPFTKIEMFIPYCGWVSLPSHCMSSEDAPKIITGTLLCDIIAGTCKAVIKCNDTVVAEASGFTAIDVPFTGENVGMKMAGIASSITSYGNQAAKTVGSVASGAMTGGAGAGAALAGGIVGMLGSYAQMYSAFNANYTEICGKTGDGCNVAGLGKVYIKIQRPKTGGTSAPYYVPDNYDHTTGFMSMKQKQISECNGLIVCANVDTSGISGATARERAEIKRLLETGIYVNLTPPEPPEP